MTAPGIVSGGRRGALARRLVILAGAVALGLVLQDLLRARLDAIAELAERDVLRARAELAFVFRAVGTLVFGVTGAVGAAIAWSSRHASDTRARLGVPLGIALLVLSLAGLALILYLAAVLAACRA